MKSILNWFVLLVSIAVIVSSCNTGVLDESSDNSTSTSDNSSSAKPEVFVATGGNGDILRSTDNGSSFDNATSPTGKTLIGVTFGNDIFLAVGNSGNIVRSTDNGSSWDNVTSPTTAQHSDIIF